MPSWTDAPIVEEETPQAKQTVATWESAPIVGEPTDMPPLPDYELQAADVMSRQIGGFSAPTVSGGVLASGARAISGAYRIGELLPENWGGKRSREQADWFANYSQALIKAADIAGEQGVVKRGATQAASNIVPLLAGGLSGSAATMIGLGVADQSNIAVTEGRQEGLKGAELGAYVGRQGLFEGVTEGLLQKFGFGGLNRVLPGAFSAAKNGVRQALNTTWKEVAKSTAKETGRTFLEENAQELVTSALQMWNDKYSGVDKSAWSLDQIARTFADTTSAVAWMTLGGAGPVHLAENVRAGRAAELQAAIEKTAVEDRIPTRKQWKEWGLDPEQGKSAQSRKEAVQQVAEELRGQYEAQQPSEPAAPPEASQEPTAPTTVQEIPSVQENTATAQLPAEQQTAATHTPEVVAEDTVPAAPAATPFTSIKNELVNEIREGRGDVPVEQMPKVTWEEMLEAAEQRLQNDPTAGRRLIEELRQQPRNLEYEEVGVAQLYYRNLENQFATADAEKAAARQANDPVALRDAEARASFLLGEIQNAEQATKDAGTIAGRALGARKIALRPDYTRASLLSRASVAKGALLSESETNQINELSAKVAILQKQLDDLNTARSEQDTTAAVDAAIKQSIPRKRFQKREPSLKKIEAQKHVQDAWADFKRTLGPPPENLITGESGALNVDAVEAGIKLAKAYADLGVVTFAEFAHSAKTFLGDVTGVTLDTLKDSWSHAKLAGYIPDLGLDSNDPGSIREEANRLTRSVVRSGITDTQAVVDAVYAELRDSLPDLSRQQVMEAIAGYGDYARLTKEEVSQEIKTTRKELARVKREIRNQLVPTDEVNAKRLEATKVRYQKKLDDLKRRIEKKDFSKVERKETPLDKEATDLKWQIKQEQDKYKALEEGWKKSQLTGLAKAWDTMGEAANFSRAMMTSFDLSAVLRQAGPSAMAHPMQAFSSLREGIRAFGSKEAEFRLAERLRNDPDVVFGQQNGLAVTATEGKLEQQEEAYRGKWASLVPGVAGSERSYVTTLNEQRSSMFKSMIDSLGGRENVSPEEAKVIANAVNVFTGRGYFTGANAAAAQTLATYFFSPRFVVSRFQLLMGQPLWRGTMRTRGLIAKEYARYLIGASTFYSMLGLVGYLSMGDDEKDKPIFEWDPRSPNFGKVRFGQTVVDPMSGLSQTSTLSARLISGQTKKSTGEVVPIRGENIPFKGLTTTDVISRFLRSKLAPLPGAAWNVAAGENIIGTPTNPLEQAWQLSAPLSMRDIYDTLQAKGMSSKLALSMLVLLGVGAQNYQDATPEAFARKIAEHPQLRGYDKKEKKYYDYSTEVDQIVREAKKRGLKASDLGPALITYMQNEGNKPETINKAIGRLYGRFNAAQ